MAYVVHSTGKYGAMFKMCNTVSLEKQDLNDSGQCSSLDKKYCRLESYLVIKINVGVLMRGI